MNIPHKSCKTIHATDWMIIDAVRYAIGRRSYQVGVTTSWLRCLWHLLDRRIQEIIQRDIEEEFQTAERTGDYSHFGYECDRREWEDVRALWKPKP